MAPPQEPPPAVSEGWQVSWSDQYNQWFYTHSTTGISQWEYPAGPMYAGQPAATPQPAYYPPAQPQYAQQGFAPPPTATQPAAPAKAGIMGKLSHLDPKAQMALAVGGGLAAGALVEHEIAEFTGPHHGGPHHGGPHQGGPHHGGPHQGGPHQGGPHQGGPHQGGPHQGGHHDVLGIMAGIIGVAGVGTLGAKLFKEMAHTAPPPAPPANPALKPEAPAYPIQAPVLTTQPPAYPIQTPQPPAYPVQVPQPPASPSQHMLPHAPGPGPGMGNLGKIAAGGMAVSGASNLLHNQGGASAGALTVTGGSGGMTPFVHGPTYSGARLIIHGAAYADMNVTDKVRALVTPEQELNFGDWNGEFGDPWPENPRKVFNVLYQYGDRPLEVWAGSTSDGKIHLKQETLSNQRMSFVNKDPGRIISLIWGYTSILNKERAEKLENDGEFDCTGDLGFGGYRNYEAWGVNAVCYYRTSDGGVGVALARPGGTVRLPWNPLAKWS